MESSPRGQPNSLFAQLGLVLTYRALSPAMIENRLPALARFSIAAAIFFAGKGIFRNNDDVRAGGNACVQRQPAGFMSP